MIFFCLAYFIHMYENKKLDDIFFRYLLILLNYGQPMTDRPIDPDEKNLKVKAG